MTRDDMMPSIGQRSDGNIMYEYSRPFRRFFANDEGRQINSWSLLPSIKVGPGSSSFTAQLPYMKIGWLQNISIQYNVLLDKSIAIKKNEEHIHKSCHPGVARLRRRAVSSGMEGGCESRTEINRWTHSRGCRT
jgi:hypothetical protein